MQPLRTLHLFAGIGGGILADVLLGHRPVCAVELRPYCQKVLAARQADGCLPWFPLFADVRQFDGRVWRGLVDIVAGGFPCQPFSHASRGRANADDLWPEMRRVIAECEPEWVFAENVVKDPIRAAADDLFTLGYSTRYCRLDAAHLGAPHRRPRWWLVAHADSDGQSRVPEHVTVAGVPSLPGLAWWAEDLSSTLGVDDGDARRMERLEALGNGQVSVVAAWAWQLLRDDLGGGAGGGARGRSGV